MISLPEHASTAPPSHDLGALHALALSTLCGIIRDPATSAQERRLAAIAILRYADPAVLEAAAEAQATSPAPPAAPTPASACAAPPINFNEPPTLEEIAEILARDVASLRPRSVPHPVLLPPPTSPEQNGSSSPVAPTCSYRSVVSTPTNGPPT